MKDKSVFPQGFRTVESVRKEGFEGFRTIASLMNDASHIPKTKGIYLIVNPGIKPAFLYPGSGGYFKGKDPNVPVDELSLEWVDDTVVVYIGKAGTEGSPVTLHSRIKQYLSFGRGKRSPHWGGRFIWQLENVGELLVCWKELLLNDPRDTEKALITTFKEQYGKRPFANLTD